MIKQKIQQLKYRSLNNLKTIVNTFPLILKQKPTTIFQKKKKPKQPKNKKNNKKMKERAMYDTNGKYPL